MPRILSFRSKYKSLNAFCDKVMPFTDLPPQTIAEHLHKFLMPG